MINVIGMGYIGLPTALMLAAHGEKVIGTDYNKELVKTLQSGKLTFQENGLDGLFSEALKQGIAFTDEYKRTDMYIVSVPTPYDKESKKIDPSYVITAVKSVIKVCPEGATLVIESTIPPGTIDTYVRPVLKESGFIEGKNIHLAHAPERIIPGNMIYELIHNNRTIGADRQEIGEKVKNIYQSFCQGEIIVTDIRTAEMTKVVENTFRDINIAFANELMKICRSGEMDVYEIIRIANKHPRVNILSPGPGVGGHCISVDPWFLVGDYPGLANLILTARKTNDSMPEFVLKRIYEIMRKEGIEDAEKVGIYGLTYKENVDDMRESPTLQMLKCMDEHLAGGRVKVYDPYIEKDIVANQYHDLERFLEDVTLVVLMVAHNEIIENMEKLNGKTVLDTRKVCDCENVYWL